MGEIICLTASIFNCLIIIEGNFNTRQCQNECNQIGGDLPSHTLIESMADSVVNITGLNVTFTDVEFDENKRMFVDDNNDEITITKWSDG